MCVCVCVCVLCLYHTRVARVGGSRNSRQRRALSERDKGAIPPRSTASVHAGTRVVATLPNMQQDTRITDAAFSPTASAHKRPGGAMGSWLRAGFMCKNLLKSTFLGRRRVRAVLVRARNGGQFQGGSAPGAHIHTCREQVLRALPGPPSSPLPGPPSPVCPFVCLSISFRALGSSARSPAPYLCRRASCALRPAYVSVGLCGCARVA